MLRIVLYTFIYCVCSFSSMASQSDLADLSLDNLEAMSLSDLLDLDVVTPSRTKQKLIDSPANITVITQVQITQRGYSNLVEVLQDVPGFDFATYEDGGGEYPTHSSNRGIGGGPGNPKLLVLLDGVVQNHVAFNWSQLWGEENIFEDLDRIEIIQGPGSAAYGANAFSGVIHFITKKYVSDDHTTLKLTGGEDSTRGLTLTHQSLYKNLHMNGAIKLYNSDGDQGDDRYDPGDYFSAHEWPTSQTRAYDENGDFRTDYPNPYAGQLTPSGFNTDKDIWSVRANVSYFSSEAENNLVGVSKISLGFYLWDKEEGLGSYVPNYEYQSWEDSFKSHQSGKHIYLDLDYRLTDDLVSRTRTWYRENRQKPDTGFRYTYQFVDLTKSYHSFSSQVGVEEQIEWQASDDTSFVLGFRFMQSDKMDQLASLGGYQEGHDPVTDASWQYAITTRAGQPPQLGLAESRRVDIVNEHALYAILDSKITDHLSYSAGLRYDHSDDFGDTYNPRLGLIYQVPNDIFDKLNMKLLYGQAFREPSIFELTDEFRGNGDLDPEEITTYEFITQGSWSAADSNNWLDEVSFSGSVFYSELSNLIALKSAGSASASVFSSGNSGSGFVNTDEEEVVGFTLSTDIQFTASVKAYANYHLNQGDSGDGYEGINNTAEHKFNTGVHYSHEWVNVDLRLNYVGERTVPDTNRYFTEDAPSYTKINLNITGQEYIVSGFEIEPQLKIENVFDERYYGVGRQDGASLKTDYDPVTNPNPLGFIPAYHPQSGRQIFFSLNVKM